MTMQKIKIGCALFFVLVLSTNEGLVPAVSNAFFATSAIAQTPTPTPTATPTPTPESSPTPASTPTPTPTPQSTPVQLSERANYIGQCRSSGKTPLKVYADTAKTQVVSELKPFTKVTLTGVLGEGIAQIGKPAVGWVEAATLLTNCDAGSKAR